MKNPSSSIPSPLSLRSKYGRGSDLLYSLAETPYIKSLVYRGKIETTEHLRNVPEVAVARVTVFNGLCFQVLVDRILIDENHRLAIFIIHLNRI